MRYRLREGNGEAFYYIGVEDNGTAKGLKKEEMLSSLKTICLMANNSKADCILLKWMKGF